MNKIAKAAHSWDREPDNWYVEPSWVTKRLCEVEVFSGRTADPCAGMGNIIKGASEAGVTIEGHDLRNRGYGLLRHRDFFDPPACHGQWPVENIISNPPYGPNKRGVDGERPRIEEQFLLLALERTRRKIALFLPSNWINSASRGAWLRTTPLMRVYFVGPRPSCPPGHILANGGAAGGGKQDFAWFVWLHGYDGEPSLRWLWRDG
jgi:hypothetical protein